jgi:plasmid maintenance system antidote protein VapI
MKPILALDFDGVINDSLDECLISSYNAWQVIEKSGHWAYSNADIPQTIVDCFRANRYLARNGAEFWLILMASKLASDTITAEVFEQLRQEHSSFLHTFEQIFFDVRNRYRTEDMERWLNLHTRYDQSKERWADLLSSTICHIVTTKDLASVKLFNQHWELGIREDNLWTRELDLPKSEIIELIADRANCTTDQIYFVDDHPDQVAIVASTGANYYWASWGFQGALVKSRPDGILFPALTKLADLFEYLP